MNILILSPSTGSQSSIICQSNITRACWRAKST